jgi:hypothetical protein
MQARPRKLWFVITLVALACDRGGTEQRGSPEPDPKPKPSQTGEPQPQPHDPPSTGRAPGAVPFDFPALGTGAKKGEFVLAPSKGWIEEAFEKGADKQPFIFYGAWMVEPGEKESMLRTLPGQAVTIPNAMIIPIGPGQSAKPGDVVLTAWTSGSGMQRAIVVEGGTPESPRVRYLDLDLESPSGWGKKEDTLGENTFRVLKKPGEPGTTVGCKDGARTTRFIVIGEHDGKLLGVGFAGKVKVLARDSCKNLPIVPNLKPGERVYVPVIGAFTEGKVTKLDQPIGRVWVRHEFGGKDTEEAFSFTNVAPSL